MRQMVIRVIDLANEMKKEGRKTINKTFATKLKHRFHDMDARWYSRYDWSVTLQIHWPCPITGENVSQDWTFNKSDIKRGDWDHMIDIIKPCLSTNHAEELTNQLRILPKLVEAENHLRAVVQAARINAEAIIINTLSEYGKRYDRSHYRCGLYREIGQYFELLLDDKSNINLLCDGPDVDDTYGEDE